MRGNKVFVIDFSQRRENDFSARDIFQAILQPRPLHACFARMPTIVFSRPLPCSLHLEYQFMQILNCTRRFRSELQI